MICHRGPLGLFESMETLTLGQALGAILWETYWHITHLTLSLATCFHGFSVISAITVCHTIAWVKRNQPYGETLTPTLTLNLTPNAALNYKRLPYLGPVLSAVSQIRRTYGGTDGFQGRNAAFFYGRNGRPPFRSHKVTIQISEPTCPPALSYCAHIDAESTTCQYL